MRVVTVDQMRAIEAEADRTYGLSGPALMAVAGASAAAIAREWADSHLERLAGSRWLFLIGPGNNGGDGRIMALHMSRAGASVTLLDWKAGRLQDTTGADIGPGDVETLARLLNETDVVVDALLGIGHSRPLGDEMRAVIRQVRDARLRRATWPQVIAIDLPSGVHVDTGEVDAGAVVADLTITLACPKIGLFWYPAAAYVGELRVGSIGLPAEMNLGGVAEQITPEMIGAILPARPSESNKGTYGKALIVAGSPRFPGAAVLASTAAARSGTGLVTIATTLALASAYVSVLPEAVYVPLSDDPAQRAAAILTAARGHDAILIGPGLDQSPGTAEWFRAVLAGLVAMPDVERPRLIVDADGLNLLSKIESWWTLLPPSSVLTPHPGEMARLMGASAMLAGSGLDRLAIVRERARIWNQIVVLKGAVTLIVAPDRSAQELPWLYFGPNPAMATAGTGDVLAGTIVSLLAQGLKPFEAAAAGVALHGGAGRLAAHTLGDVRAGMLASDVAHQLPAARERLQPSERLA